MSAYKSLVILALACSQAVQGAINLGTAKTFATIAGSQLANTGTTSVDGDIGTFPGLTIGGYPPGVLTGSINPGTPLAQAAQRYCSAAYKQVFTSPATGALPPNLSGLVLPPGVYKFSAPNVVLNTVLTLNGASNPNGQWIFLITGTFTTSAGSSIQVINGGQTCNVYFGVQQSASIGDSTRFQGNILAYDTIKVGKMASNLRGTFCTIKGPIVTYYNKLQAYLPACFN